MENVPRTVEQIERDRNLAISMEKDEFLKSLTPVQLATYIKLIQGAAQSSEAASYLVGEAVAMMKFVHGVDPRTGRDPYADLLKQSVGADPHDIND